MERQTVILLVVALVAIIEPAAGKVYKECQLATILQNHGFTKSLIPDWVCLIMSESSGNTAAKGGPNSNGSYDYGLFQVEALRRADPPFKESYRLCKRPGK
ncbi:hypothetical protein B7P43_G13072 [Cryptotermes secundus]|uniref:lysozyme n=1 Tax=Cryptotermes secundus TaxID=105785 RepID=A0A2J7QM80_9NEOP|nr:hypothetical protein B7P43_G13072 [Cryptotermes secundus]